MPPCSPFHPPRPLRGTAHRRLDGLAVPPHVGGVLLHAVPLGADAAARHVERPRGRSLQDRVGRRPPIRGWTGGRRAGHAGAVRVARAESARHGTRDSRIKRGVRGADVIRWRRRRREDHCEKRGGSNGRLARRHASRLSGALTGLHELSLAFRERELRRRRTRSQFNEVGVPNGVLTQRRSVRQWRKRVSARFHGDGRYLQETASRFSLNRRPRKTQAEGRGHSPVGRGQQA
jgi:hypothetical protein